MSGTKAQSVRRREEGVLVCDGMRRSFGGLTALVDVSLSVGPGEIMGLVGPNGSGKTTLVNAICGFYPPNRGRVLWDGRDITGERPYRIARLGIARTFQNLALFRGMTVLDNILLGRHVHMRPGAWKSALYWWWGCREEITHRRRVEEVIDFLQLESVRHEPIEVLPLGVQKCVELARALVAQPKLLILDEPMTGMNQEEKEYMARFILDTQIEWGVAVLLIEHHMDVVTGICHRLAVLDHGEKIAEGPPAAVMADARVVAAYLGRATADAG